jgi:RNA polymerase sigma factor (sigma-70 family)
MFRILINQAKTRGERERRTRPFSSFAAELEADEPSVDPDRFIASGRWAGFWAVPPVGRDVPEARVLAAEAGDRLVGAIEALPPTQRTVITLRDVKGLSAAEVCELLDISEANQRVLLHRARSKTRATLGALPRRARLAAALLRGGRRDRAAGVPAARSTRLAARRLPPRAGSVRVYPSSSRSVSHTDWNARSAA